MKYILLIVAIIFLNCNNPVGTQDDDIHLISRPDMFYSIPEKYKYQYKFKGNVCSIIEITEDIYTINLKCIKYLICKLIIIKFC